MAKKRSIIKNSRKKYNVIKQLLIPIFLKNLVLFIITLLILSITTILGIIGPVIIKQAIDIDIKTKNISGLLTRSFQYIGIILSLSSLSALYIYLTELYGQNFLFSLKTSVFSHILRLPVKFFDKTPVGTIMSRIESDGESVRQFFTQTVISLFTDILMFAGMIFVMFRYSPKLTLIVIVILPLMILISFYYKKFVSPRWVKIRKYYAEMLGEISDSIKGYKIIQLFNGLKWSLFKITNIIKKYYSIYMKNEVITIFYYNSLLIFEAIALSLIIWYGGSGYLKNKITVGTIVLFITYIRQFFTPIRNLSSQFQLIQKAAAALKRIEELLSEKEEFSENEIIKINKFNNAIKFQNLYFGYNKDKYILKNINLEIKKGEKVAIVGRTGSGKTTLIMLLLKFYRNYEGEIFIDNNELKKIKTKNLRNIIGTVFQDNFLFPDTIYKNIVLDRDIPKDEVIKAIKELNLEQVFNRFENHIDTVVKKDGVNLSSGEKQIISILRAYVKNPEILILDEATSSIDNKTELLIYKAFERFMKGRTAIIIAHRLSTIKMADKIIVFKNGEIIEEGTHKELLNIKGTYWNLYKTQFQGENLYAK